MSWIGLPGLILLGVITICSCAMLENEIIGVPQIECSENAVTFTVKTKAAFRGNIYVQGKYNVPQCKQEYFNNDYNGATLSIPMGECGMSRVRQLEPNGMNYLLTFVANFHPQFVTKIDRAYNVRCFYAHADKTVGSQIDVDQLPPESLEGFTTIMPHCEYSLRSQTLEGAKVRFAHIGDQLVHRWECDNPNYGMLVKNCHVSDGAGTTQQVLDARGCPIVSPVIQGELTYDRDLNLAFVTVSAFKFQDRGQLNFQCQIQVCNKREDECMGVTPPNCPAVNKAEFLPNSRIDTKVDPTQVVGTFEEPTTISFLTTTPTTQKPSFIPNVGKQPYTSNQPFPTFARNRDVPAADIIARSFPPYAPHMIPSQRIAAYQNHNSPYFRKKDPPLPLDSKNETDNEAVVHFDNDISQEKAWKDKYVILKRINRSTRPMTISAPTVPTSLAINEKLRSRIRRAEEETMDVIAEPIYISEPEDVDVIDNHLSNTHDISKDNLWSRETFCTDRYGVYALAASFAFITLLALPAVIYTFYDLVFLRSKRKKGLITSTQPTPHLPNRIRPFNTEVGFDIPRITPRQILNR